MPRKRQRTQSDVLRIVRAYMHRADLLKRGALLRLLLADEAVARFVGGNSAGAVDSWMSREFAIITESAVRDALKRKRRR